MHDEGIGKEWGVKSIKSNRDDGHGNIEFLVEWDGNWVDTWNPLKTLKMQRGTYGRYRKYAVQRHTGRKIRQINPTPGRDIKTS